MTPRGRVRDDDSDDDDDFPDEAAGTSNPGSNRNRATSADGNANVAVVNNSHSSVGTRTRSQTQRDVLAALSVENIPELRPVKNSKKNSSRNDPETASGIGDAGCHENISVQIPEKSATRKSSTSAAGNVVPDVVSSQTSVGSRTRSKRKVMVGSDCLENHLKKIRKRRRLVKHTQRSPTPSAFFHT